MTSTLENVRSPANRLADLPYAFINRQAERKFRWLGLLWIGLLYAAGIYFWGSFLNWTRTPLDFQDWGVINSPRLDFFSDALRSGSLPLHMKIIKFEGQETPLHGTDRYFVMPDVITTPQTLLLLGLTVNQFVMVQLLVDFTLGTLGLLWFRRKYDLSLLSYGILFLLFSFNGYIQSHYAVGHMTWGGYFLFPLFIALMIQMIEDKPDWIWVGKLSFLLLYMVLAGSQHHFTWALLFLGILAVVSFDKIKWIILAGLFAGLLSAARLLPPALILQDVYAGTANRLLPGYPSVLDVPRAMVTLFPPSEQNLIVTSVSWLRHWEFDVYVGWIGAAFLLYFGIYRCIRYSRQYLSLLKLLIPTGVLLLLTLGSVYRFVRFLHIPLLDGERVPSRMIGLVLAVIILVAAVHFQRWLDDSSLPKPVLLALGFLVFFWIAYDLWAHSSAWNLDAFRNTFGPAQMMLDGNSVTSRVDRRYAALILLGLFLSISSGLFLSFRMWRDRQLAVK